jgi:hypothetical protein
LAQLLALSIFLCFKDVRINPSSNSEAIDRSLPTGPASYYPQNQSTSPAYTLLGKPGTTSSVLEVPAPNKYEVIKSFNYTQLSLKKSISTCIPTIRQGIPLDVPGPGAYNPKNLDNIVGPK